MLLVAAAALLAALWQWIDTIPLGIAVAVILTPLQRRLSSTIPEWLSAGAIILVLLFFTVAGVLFTVTVMQENLVTNQEILGKAAGYRDPRPPVRGVRDPQGGNQRDNGEDPGDRGGSRDLLVRASPLHRPS